MQVIYCVGENQQQHEDDKMEEVLCEQLKVLWDNTKDWSKVVIAYEPVWALEQKTIASGDLTQDACAEIRRLLTENVSAEVAEATRIVFGGSVTETNGPNLIKQPDVDGFLVGATCIKPGTFRTLFGIVEARATHLQEIKAGLREATMVNLLDKSKNTTL